MAKLSKSFIAKKGIVYGAEQFLELARTFMEKTGVMEPVLDDKGRPTGAFRVLHQFKTVMEIDMVDVRGDIPVEIQNYQKFKDNTTVRTIKTQVSTVDPGDDEKVTPPVIEDEQDDTPAIGIPLETEQQSVFPAGNKAAAKRGSFKVENKGSKKK